MISYAPEPWKKGGAFNRHKNSIIASFVLVILFLSYFSLLFTSNAEAQDLSQCSRVIVSGDLHGVGDQAAGIEDKLRNNGAKDVQMLVEKGRRLAEVTEELNSRDLSNACIVVEAGSGNYADDDAQIEKEIDQFVNTTRTAKKIYWITPVASDIKENWNKGTKKFNTILSRKLAGKDQFLIINIQGFSLDQSLFEPDGIKMTMNGYRTRVDSIIKAIKTDLANQEKESSSTPPPPPPPSSGGSGGAPGGSSGGGAPAPAPASDGTEEGGGDVERPNEDDDQKSSPRAFAVKANSITDIQEASRYLAIKRWSMPTIPINDATVDDGESIIELGDATFTSAILSATHTVMSIGLLLTSLAFTTGIASLMVIITDSFYGMFFGISTSGAGGNENVVFSLVGLLITVALGFSIVRALSFKLNMSLRDRLVMVIGSLVKVTLLMTFFIYSGTASKKNGDDGLASSYYDQAVTSLKDGGSDGSSGDNNFFKNNSIDKSISDWTNKKFGDSDEPTANVARVGSDRSMSHPGTWHVLSLGWIISIIYQFSQFIGSSIVRAIALIINAPLDMFKTSLSHANEGSNRNNTVCERYVDAMHFVYSNTAAMKNNMATQLALRAFDLVYLDLVLRPYSEIYGGNNDSSRNSWCWNLEIKAGHNAGEWAMLARTAGAYGYVLGTGDLFSYASQYANGNHALSDMALNLSSAPSGNSAGLIVDAQGNWAGDGGDKIGLNRAETFMGYGRGNIGLSEARYYFAACHFDIGSTSKPVIREDWKGVRAAGPSGGYSGMTAEQDKKVAEKFKVGAVSLADIDCRAPADHLLQDGGTEEAVGGGGFSNTLSDIKDKVVDGAKAVKDKFTDSTGDDDKKDGDKKDDTKKDSDSSGDKDSSEDGDDENNVVKNGGLGDVNDKGYPATYAYRWNYDRLPVKFIDIDSLANLDFFGDDNAEDKKIEKSVKRLYGDDIEMGDFPGAWNPSNKFHGNDTQPNGDHKGKGKNFWDTLNGNPSFMRGSLAVLSLISCILFALLATPLIVIGAIFSFLFSFMMLFAPGIIALNLLIYAFRAGTKEMN